MVRTLLLSLSLSLEAARERLQYGVAPLLHPCGASRLATRISAAAAALAVLAVDLGDLDPARAAEPTRPGVSFDATVTVAQAKRQCFADTIALSGALVPRREILVRPDREGLQVSQILVEPGDSVASGQVLARLTPPEGQPGAGTTFAVQAPAAGVVSSSSMVLGTLASAKGPPLFSIVAQGEMELLAEAPIKYAQRLVADQPARIEILGVGEAVRGKVRLVSTGINPITQLGEVRIFIGSDARLRVGAFGRATIDVGQRCGAAIPLSALLYGADGTVVQVVRDNRVETRRVSVGLLAKGSAEIREGLAEGDIVVARSGAFLREGDRVNPVRTDEPAGR